MRVDMEHPATVEIIKPQDEDINRCGCLKIGAGVDSARVNGRQRLRTTSIVDATL
jgi:hypothetical protein